MERINKAAAVGVVFFSVMLAGFVGLKIEQTTVSILAGALIGVVIAIPTTAAIMLVGLRKPDETKSQAPAQNQHIDGVPDEPVWTQRPGYNEMRQDIEIIEFDVDGYEWWELRDVAARATYRTPREAGILMSKGYIRFVPPKNKPQIGGAKTTSGVNLIEAPRR